MKQWAKILLLTLGFGVLAALLGFVTNGQVGAQGPPGGLNVNVVNTPLPVTGTLGISGTPNVQVHRLKAWVRRTVTNGSQNGAGTFRSGAKPLPGQQRHSA